MVDLLTYTDNSIQLYPEEENGNDITMNDADRMTIL